MTAVLVVAPPVAADDEDSPGPAPEETQDPAPEETQDPAPEETQDPAPEETQEPSPTSKSPAGNPVGTAHERVEAAETYNSAPVLDGLASDGNDYVRLAVAGNGSASAATLDSLASDGNDYVRLAVAGNGSASAATLGSLASDGNAYVRKSVATNPNTPISVLEQLARDPNGSIRAAAQAALSRLPSSNSGSGGATAQGEDEVLRPAPSLESEVPKPATRPQGNPRGSAQQRLKAAETYSDARTLSSLARDGNDYVRLAVAQNSAVSPATLESLSKDGNAFVRKNVALNPNTPYAVLKQLATDSNGAIRKAAQEALLVQESTTRPTDVVVVTDEIRFVPVVASAVVPLKMANSVDNRLVQAATSTDEQVWEQLAKDSSSEVRRALIDNPNVSLNVLEVISADPDPVIAGTAGEKLLAIRDALEKVRGMESCSACALAEAQRMVYATQLVQTSTIPSSQMNPNEISNSLDAGRRRALALNPSLAASHLKVLARDPDPLVRMAVALNPATPGGVLRLMRRDNSEVSRVVAQRTQGDQRFELEIDQYVQLVGETEPSRILELASSSNPRVAFLMAVNPFSPAAALNSLAVHSNNEVRAAVASNPKTETATLESLASQNEYSFTVRNSAIRTLDSLGLLPAPPQGQRQIALGVRSAPKGGNVFYVRGVGELERFRKRPVVEAGKPFTLNGFSGWWLLLPDQTRVALGDGASSLVLTNKTYTYCVQSDERDQKMCFNVK